MTKKLTKIIENEKENIKEIAEGIKSRDYDFSSEESKKRTQRILEKQKAIRKSIAYTKYDLDKASAPYSRPYSH